MIKKVSEFSDIELVVYKWLLQRSLATGTIDNPISAIILNDRNDILNRQPPLEVMDAYLNCWSDKALDDIYYRVIEALKGADNSSYNEGYEAGMAHVWNLLKNKYL